MKFIIFLMACLMVFCGYTCCAADISITESLSKMPKNPTDAEVERLIEILKKHSNVATAIGNEDYKSALFLLDYVDESTDIDYLLIFFTGVIQSRGYILNEDQLELMYKIIDYRMFNANSYTSFLGAPKGFYKKDTFHTLLSFALHFNLFDVFNILLEAGADINAQQGCVLTHAIESGDIEKLRLALESGASIEVLEPMWVQPTIESTCDIDKIKLLLDHGATFKWDRLLLNAIQRNKIDTVKFIMELGVHVGDGSNIVFYAVFYGDCDLLNYILDYGFNLIDGNSEKLNYLAWAIRQFDVKKVRLLLERGVDTSIKVDGLTDILNFTLSLRTQNKNEESKKDEILRILVKHGVALS